MPAQWLRDELVDHLIGVRLSDAPHTHRCEPSAEHNTHGADQPDADDQPEAGHDRTAGHFPCVESNDDHIVDHPANGEA